MGKGRNAPDGVAMMTVVESPQRRWRREAGLTILIAAAFALSAIAIAAATANSEEKYAATLECAGFISNPAARVERDPVPVTEAFVRADQYRDVRVWSDGLGLQGFLSRRQSARATEISLPGGEIDW